MVHVSDTVYRNPSITGATILHYEWQEMRLVIKPTATDSVIELKYNLFGDFHNDLCFRITRNISGTDVLVVPTTAYNEGVLGIGVHDGPNNTSTPCQHPISWYDEPNTTSTVTYKLWLGASQTGSGFTAHLNRAGSSLGNYIEAGVSTAAAIEHPQQTIMHNPRYNSVIEQEGQVLETLAGVCDGRSVTVSSGTYTLENVSTSLNGTTTFTDMTGSKISYKPPPGTRQVIYEFEFQHNYHGTNGWGYYKFLLDGTQVGEVFELGFDNYGSSWQKVSFIFEIGQNDLSNGKISSWDSHKEIKMQFREHSSSNSQVRVHIAANWVESNTSGGGTGLIKPRIKVQPIGRKSDTTFLNSFFNERKGQVLETLAGVFDGRTIEVDSGTYTLTDVTAVQSLNTTTWTDLTNTSISYKPPAGTRQVKFRYTVAIDDSDAGSGIGTIPGWRLMIDGNAYTNQETIDLDYRVYNSYSRNRFFVIDINGTDDMANGKLSSWDTLKTVKLQVKSPGYINNYI